MQSAGPRRPILTSCSLILTSCSLMAARIQNHSYPPECVRALKNFVFTRVCNNTRVPRSPRPPQCPTAHAHKSFRAHPSVQEYTHTKVPTPTPMSNRTCSQKCFVLSEVHKSTHTQMPTPTPVPNRLAKNGQARRQYALSFSPFRVC